MVLVRNGLSNYNADEEFKKLWQESRVLKQTLTSHSKPQTYEGDNITFQSFISNANSNGYKIDYKILGKKTKPNKKVLSFQDSKLLRIFFYGNSHNIKRSESSKQKVFMLTAHAEYTIVYSKVTFLVIYFQITVSKYANEK